MSGVTLANVIKRYGETQVIHGVDLQIEHGEFCVFVGPSGCGKSTLLRMVAGLEETTDGSIRIGTRDVTREDPAERGVAMVFQTYALYPHMNVAKNMSFSLRLQKRPQGEIDKKVKDVAAMLGLSDFLSRKPGELSGGQRQRVAMGRALCRDAGTFLFDEPLSNLDAKLRQAMRVQIKHIQRELKITTVYVTHDQIEAMTLADRVVVMKQGKVQQVGTPTDIYDHPANTFVASFIGSPAMNLMEGTLQGGTFTGDNVSISGLTGPDGPVALGFRAGEATLAGGGSGQTTAVIYTIELLGDATMLTVRAGGQLVSVKAHKEFRAEIGDMVSFAVPVAICHLFNTETGMRIDAGGLDTGARMDAAV